MATASFFIRATQTTTTDNAWENAEIDLGAFVDALGKTVLRIHNIAVRYQTAGSNGPPVPDNIAGGGTAYIQYALTTQALAAADTPDLSDKALIASGSYQVATNGAAGVPATNYMVVTDANDIAPQDWSKGYLVGVETLYLNSYQDTQMGAGENTVSIVLECTSEKLTQSGAMSLALSQQ